MKHLARIASLSLLLCCPLTALAQNDESQSSGGTLQLGSSVPGPARVQSSSDSDRPIKIPVLRFFRHDPPDGPIADVIKYNHITSTDDSNPDDFWYSQRPNIIDEPVTREWDAIALINTDRSDFTDAVPSVGRGTIQWESGYTYTQNITQTTRFGQRTLPEVLLRVGITDEFELRMKWIGYTYNTLEDKPSGARDTMVGGSDLYLGFKYELMQQRDWIPYMTNVSYVYAPTGTGGISAHSVQSGINFVWGWQVRRWLFCKTSSGVDLQRNNNVFFSDQPGGVPPILMSEYSHDTLWHESVSILWQLSKRIGGFSEWYALWTQHGEVQNFVDTGLFLYATPVHQFDIRIGYGLNGTDYMFTGIGYSTKY
jgi:hypothetical protein